MIFFAILALKSESVWECAFLIMSWCASILMLVRLDADSSILRVRVLGRKNCRIRCGLRARLYAALDGVGSVL